MAHTSENKIRLLILYDFLQTETDETNPMATQAILKKLAEKGMPVSRKTLYDDIELLNRYGYDVICVRGRTNRYYVGERKFERPEVQFLLNALGASQAIPVNKTQKLIQKLLQLLGVGEAVQVRDLVPVSRQKHTNERVYYTIDAISVALSTKKKLSFLYFDYGVNGQREYRKNGRRYVINPLGMAYSNNQLYLIGYHDKYDDIAHYRIDRMDEAAVMKKTITPKKQFENFDIETYNQALFDMYAGEEREVELIFPKELLEIAIDRFGEDISPVCVGDGYLVRAKIQVSKTFFAWLTTFEGNVRINAPQSIVEQYAEFIKKQL